MSEWESRSDFHELDNKKKKTLQIIGLVSLVAILIFSVAYYKMALNRSTRNTEETVFEIEPGSSIVDISAKLSEEGLVNSSALFIFHVFLTGSEKNIQAGVYSIPPGISVKELTNIFQHGTRDVTVTFIEGWRLEQFALRADARFNMVSYEDFMTKAQNLEGYLFPDTYIFPYDISTEELIGYLRATFDYKTKEVLENEAAGELGLSKEEIIILASLVEREVFDEEDRRKVAGVLLNRHRAGMNLGVDATTQYYIPYLRTGCESIWFRCFTGKEASEVEWWPEDITGGDLVFDSEYNTRLNEGFPPTPISSISLSSLEAIVYHETVPYLYYLNDSTGRTHFSETLEQHEQNIARYLN